MTGSRPARRRADGRGSARGCASVGDVEGWVVYPTREETVAALVAPPRRAARALPHPDAGLGGDAWAWDKRNTYARARRAWHPGAAHVARLHRGRSSTQSTASPPYVIKPAIKEHFFYATRCKAWRADTPEELVAAVPRTRRHSSATDEVVVQELIPGDGDTQLAYCAFFKDGARAGEHGGQAAAAASGRVRPRQHVRAHGRAFPSSRTMSVRFLRSIGYYGLVELEYKHDVRDGLTKLLDVNARTWGYHSLGPARRRRLSLPSVCRSGRPPGSRSRFERAPGVSWIRLATDLPTAAVELRTAPARLARLPAVAACVRRRVRLQPDDPRPGFAELALLPYLAVKRGI